MASSQSSSPASSPRRARFDAIMQQFRAGALEEAEHAIMQALRLDPDDLNFLHLGGMIAAAGGDHGKALARFKKAIMQKPDWLEAKYNLANSLIAHHQTKDALAILQSLVEANPGQTEFWLALARAQQAEKILPDAINSLKKAQSLKPSAETAAHIWLLQRQICDWSADAPATLTPAAAIVATQDPLVQKDCAAKWAREKFSAITPLPPRDAPVGDRMRIAYLSSDFHAHATAWLMAELFELHDRARFEIFVYSYGPHDASAIRKRIETAADHFIDVSAMTARGVAERIRADEIGILIDLKGYTRGGRLEILAHRPAPLQMHWLGFPGTTGAHFIDCFIADATTIPPAHEAHFTEQIIRLPDCYQINDRRRPLPDAKPRADYGLPHGATVLASFNQTYKITPEIFALWCDILREKPETVLWLYESNPFAAENLRKSAARHKIDPARLIFAGPVAQADHLARYHHVDLALDTYPVGGHTTTSDALWMATPVVTLYGETFVSRVAASLLHACGLDELAAQDMASYKQVILALINDAPRCRALRDKLAAGRKTLPLFDTPRFVGYFEQALTMAWKSRGNI